MIRVMQSVVSKLDQLGDVLSLNDMKFEAKNDHTVD